MPPKRKKSKSKPTKSKQKKSKRTISKTAATKRALSSAKHARPQKKAAPKKQSKKKLASAPKQKAGRRGQQFESDWRQAGEVPVPQSEDFQGLSRAQDADSESVDELVEEGNAFEAGAVEGVEQADNADEKEDDTHQVPEDDVPEEYLDKDE